MDGKHSVTALYDRLCPARRTLITPVTLTEKQYAEKWQSVIWQGKSFAEDAPQYFTAKQERVRSKSEVIIADTLARYGVPYRYEFPVSLKKDGNLITVYPDFMCLNLRTRDEFFWEHFGMMDDPDYVQKTVSKVSLYAQNGIFPGRGLIISMESSSETLNTKDIEKIIQSFLK